MPGFAPPVVGVFDTPTTSIALNVEWRSYIVGILESLLTDCVFGIGQEIYISHKPPVWSGDDDDQFLADNEIQKIISALANGQGLVMIPPGSIQMYAGTTAPEGWLLCDGFDYLKADYPELWDVLGTAFEMSSIRFVVPDMVRRSPIGYDPNTGNYDEMGALLGSATHTLSVDQMPSHTHTQDSHNHTQNSHNHSDPAHNHGILTKAAASGFGSSAIALSNAAGDVFKTSETSTAGLSSATATNVAATATNQPTGGGQAHNIVHPVTVVNYIIKT